MFSGGKSAQVCQVYVHCIVYHGNDYFIFHQSTYNEDSAQTSAMTIGRLKMQGLKMTDHQNPGGVKMQDVKLKDQIATHENAKHKNARHEIAGHEKAGQCWMHGLYRLL